MSQPSQELTAGRTESPYVRYLEGLRGLAALDVTLYHVWGHTLDTTGTAAHATRLSEWIEVILRGRMAVAVFIVLSGYLLMRPAAKSSDGKIPGGIWPYILRRARRILPPYYAALLLAVLLEISIPALRTSISKEWADSLPPNDTPINLIYFTKAIVYHVLLIHNFSYRWADTIDSPMWTVATEWQIYFIFPLVLLPFWRKTSSIALVVFGTLLGLGIYRYSPRVHLHLHVAAPWFIGLFAFGMAAAARERSGVSRANDRRIFGTLALCLYGIYAVLSALIQLKVLGHLQTKMETMITMDWPMEILVGAATACLVAHLSAVVREKPNLLIKFLSARWLVWIGVSSYSLYLIHDPLLALFKIQLLHHRISPIDQFLLMLFVGVPIVIAITYGFHLIFERPFMSSRRVHGAEALRRNTDVAAIAPA